jgi:hypothetical protein
MGVRAGLTVISAFAFEQITFGKEPELGKGERYSIDKAWQDFHLVFQNQNSPLNLAIAGDCLHVLSPHTLEDFWRGGHDYYVGFMSPQLVQKLAVELSHVTLSQLQQWYDELNIGSYDCDQCFFAQLNAAYRDSASTGSALMICIA